MIFINLSLLLVACLRDVASFTCDDVIQYVTLPFYRDPSSKWTYTDMLAVQHRNPIEKKCNFLANKSMLVTGCLNITGMCQDMFGSKHTLDPLKVVRDSFYERAPRLATDPDLISWYGPGMLDEKRSDVFDNFSKVTQAQIYDVCDMFNPYRSIDGSCNNLVFPYAGMQGTIQRRFLTTDYTDGISAPKTHSYCIRGTSLPSPREVSNVIHAAGVIMEPDSTRSLFIMQMGQFLAVDIVLTPIETRSNGEPLNCCGVDRTNPNCFPIKIPPNDPRFLDCMDFARSKGVSSYVSSLLRSRRVSPLLGFREQINIQTAYLDLSMVYGATAEESSGLRSFSGGKLKTVLNKLQRDVNEQLCRPAKPTDPLHYYCTKAGDARVNEQPGLSSLHTIFMREHNRLAKLLAVVNPTWDDEKLFQEARKINIAQWQHIVFSEYLPETIGSRAMSKYNLHVSPSGYQNTYWYLVDPSVVNSFAAAVMRFGHSLVHNQVKLAQLNNELVFLMEELKDHFFEPQLYHTNNHTGMDNILKWMASTACPLSDRKLEHSIRQFLFLDSNGDSLDLASLNIQRGRDHGLPSYNKYRVLVCKLPPARHFGTGFEGLVDHDPEVARLLSTVYNCPDDIDLFTGFMTEKRNPGSQLGPTGECIMGFQMRRLKDGDRFFYERLDVFAGGFTPAQLEEIKNVRMSDLFCLNSADVFRKRIQRNIFLQPGPLNIFVDCSTVRGINISFWDV